MKTLIYFILSTTFLPLLAQTDTLHIHYFSNSKKVSTIITIENQREGKAKAYNKEGKLIYERNVRRFAGSAMVTFTHYDDGAVKKAVYSSAPDAGIQWYKTYTDFSVEGTLTNEIEDSYDQRNTLVLKTPQPQKEEVKIDPKPEIAICAAMHENKIEVINHTPYKITFVFNYQGKQTLLELKAGGRAMGPSYISADLSSPIKDNMTYQYTVGKKHKKVTELINHQSIEALKTIHVIHLFESVR